MTYPVPEWLQSYIERVRDALGLSVWEIRPVICLQPADDDPGADARCLPNSAYLNAEIHFREIFMRHESCAGKVLVIHELLHVADCERDVFAEQAIRAFAPEQNHEFLLTQMTEINERRVVRLSRQIYRMLEAAGDFDTGEPLPKAQDGALALAESEVYAALADREPVSAGNGKRGT